MKAIAHCFIVLSNVICFQAVFVQDVNCCKRIIAHIIGNSHVCCLLQEKHGSEVNVGQPLRQWSL